MLEFNLGFRKNAEQGYDCQVIIPGEETLSPHKALQRVLAAFSTAYGDAAEAKWREHENVEFRAWCEAKGIILKFDALGQPLQNVLQEQGYTLREIQNMSSEKLFTGYCEYHGLAGHASELFGLALQLNQTCTLPRRAEKMACARMKRISQNG